MAFTKPGKGDASTGDKLSVSTNFATISGNHRQHARKPVAGKATGNTKLQSSRLYKIALGALGFTGLDDICAPLTRGSGIIFMLHNVRPAGSQGFAPNGILEITPEFLEDVIGNVRDAGYDFLSLDEAFERLQCDQPPNRPFACFTFDDGYRDNRDYAYPIMKKRGVPFTIYVAADYADGRGELWWLTLEEVIRRSNSITLTMDGADRRFATRTEAGKWRAFKAIYRWIRQFPDDKVHAVIRKLAATAGVDPLAPCRDLVMNWDELRELAADPLVTIGAHTLSHVSLAKLSGDAARREMSESLARVSAELGRPCTQFSYPYGDEGSCSHREFELAAELGVKTAVTTGKGVLRWSDNKNLHALPRFSLNGEYQDARYLKVLMSGLPFMAWNLVRRAIKVARVAVRRKVSPTEML